MSSFFVLIRFITLTKKLQKLQKVLQIQKKALSLHSLNENVEQNGLVAQLNRASDYGSEGYRFESCRDHKKELKRVPFLF